MKHLGYMTYDPTPHIQKLPMTWCGETHWFYDMTGWWFQIYIDIYIYIVYVHLYLEDFQFDYMFQKGWNHQLDMTVTLWSNLLFIWCPSPKHGAPPIRVRCWVLWKMLASGHSLWRCSKYPWFRVRWGDIWVKYRFHYLLSLQIAVDI